VTFVIRIRRIKTRIPFSRVCEIELARHGWADLAECHATRAPSSLLEPLLGVGDSWSLVREADRQWKAGNRGWAVESEEGVARS
jgi:hypothetical protein